MPRIAALLTFWLCLLVGGAARAEEYFDRYHSDIAIAKNGTRSALGPLPLPLKLV